MTTFRSLVRKLQNHAYQVDSSHCMDTLHCLQQLGTLPLPLHRELITYFEALLFILAYPADDQIYAMAELELVRISGFLKLSSASSKELLVNSGMPFTSTVARFSHDAVCWILTLPNCNTTLESFEDPSLQLNDVLNLTLSTLEKSETTAGRSNMDLLHTLQIKPCDQLHFISNELSRLNHTPFIKDHFFDRLDVYIRITPRRASMSISNNKLPDITPFYHQQFLKKVDLKSIIDIPVPEAVQLKQKDQQLIISIVKKAMILTARETDPTTFMEESSFRLYRLDRGLSIALYGMIPSRQLALESYIGFTAFKNGVPVSYGGTWVFGERANFGINIFETFRNGESGYIMAQLLRVYKQVFQIQYFEVEPYQFGLDNPEGISSGAFWFYYRFGFRPIAHRIHQLSRQEAIKIAKRKSYRSNERILQTFTESSIGLKLGKRIPPSVSTMTSKVTRMIQLRFQGNRLLAETESRRDFIKNTGFKRPRHTDENQVLTEVALWANALKLKDKSALKLMTAMIKVKPKDVYAYQKLMIQFLQTISKKSGGIHP